MESTPDDSSDDGMQTVVPHEIFMRYMNSLVSDSNTDDHDPPELVPNWETSDVATSNSTVDTLPPVTNDRSYAELLRVISTPAITPLNLCDPRFSFRITLLQNSVVADAPEQPKETLDDGAKIYEVVPADHSHKCTCFDESDDDNNDNSEPPPLESEDTPDDPNAS